MTDAPRDDLPPYPDQFRNPDGTTNYDGWRAALAVWRGADTEAAPPDEDGAVAE